MEKNEKLLGGLALAAIILAGALWWTNDERPTGDTPSTASAAGNASSHSANTPATIPSGETTAASAPTPTPGQYTADALPPTSADPQLAADLQQLIGANRNRLLDTQAELRARISELLSDEGAEPLSHQDLLRWARVLYRDALLARLVHGEPEPSARDALRDLLASTQPTLNPQDIPEPLPSAGDGYGRYLQHLLQALPQDGSEITTARALDLTLKLQGLLQRRKRHSDNLFLSDVRSVVLDPSQPVPARIDYVEQFFEVGDDALAQYGATLLADVPDREALSQSDRQAIAQFLLNAQKEKNQ